jgi:hypothetical protein
MFCCVGLCTKKGVWNFDAPKILAFVGAREFQHLFCAKPRRRALGPFARSRNRWSSVVQWPIRSRDCYSTAADNEQALLGPPNPPLMAGMMETWAPRVIGVANPPVERTSAFPTKTLICVRIPPCSVRMRSRRPGCAWNSASRASRNVAPEVSTSTWPWPPVKDRNGPGIQKRTVVTAVPRSFFAVCQSRSWSFARCASWPWARFVFVPPFVSAWWDQPAPGPRR